MLVSQYCALSTRQVPAFHFLDVVRFSSPYSQLKPRLSARLPNTDDSLVLVQPGTYHGRVRLDTVFTNGITVRSIQPFRARLRNTGTVVTCYYGQGITIEGFDIAHSGPGADALVIQIQDLIGPPGGTDRTGRIVIRDNVLHDSYNNDILKINNGAEHVLVEGNLFYNQEGSDEHIDINSVSDVVVQDNVFFNDFAGSGRTNANDTSAFIVVKDSNGDSDGIEGSERITIRRNVFLNWEGSTGSNFVLLGEDGQSTYEAHDVLVARVRTSGAWKRVSGWSSPTTSKPATPNGGIRPDRCRENRSRADPGDRPPDLPDTATLRRTVLPNGVSVEAGTTRRDHPENSKEPTPSLPYSG